MSVTLKIILEDDIRRITLAEQPTVTKLNVLIRNLFVAELNNRTYITKYTDEDGDLVSITHDSELLEAWNTAANKKPSILRLRITVTGNAPVVVPRSVPTESPKPAFKKNIPKKKKSKKSRKAKKGKKSKSRKSKKRCCPIEKKCDDLSKTLLKLVDKALSHPDIIKLLNRFNVNPVIIRAQIMLFAPFLKIEYLKPFLKMDNLIPFAKLVLSQLGVSGDVNLDCLDKLKKCDPAKEIKEIFNNYKDFDCCGEIKNLMDEFGLSGFNFFNNEEEEKEEEVVTKGKKVPARIVHAAVCDVCDAKIVGIRYKCATCPDYDLCEKCEVNSSEVHDSTHVFLKILKSTYAGGRGRCGRNRGRRGKNRTCPRKRNAIDSVVDAKLVSDVTIEDGFKIKSKGEFIKIWNISNTGNCSWPEGTKLVYIGGTAMASVDSVSVATIEPGKNVDVSVDMQAPREAGRYISTFRLQKPDGIFFGHRVWCDIVVEENVQAEKEEEEEVIVIETVTEEGGVEEVVATDVITKEDKEENVLDTAVQGVLDQLQSMGFIDKEQNLKYIQLYGTADIMSIVNKLLS